MSTSTPAPADPAHHHEHHCPRPDKTRYATRQAAERLTPLGVILTGHHFRTYECPGCGWWHLTKWERPTRPPPRSSRT